MSKNIEVEIRGPLSNDQAAALRLAVASAMTHKGSFDRYMINFTTDEMKKLGVDLRARVTNGKVELIVKKGDFLSGTRAEFPVLCAEGQFIPLVQALVAVGFVDGVGCHRVSDRYENTEMELAIIDVPGHSTFYEVEMMVADGDKEGAGAKLKTWAEDHHLPIFTDDQFHAYVDLLDSEANDNLDFKEGSSWAGLTNRIAGQK